MNAENYHYSIFRRLLVYPVVIFVSLLSNDPPPPLEIAQKRENYPQTPFFQGGRGVRGVIMKIKKRQYLGGIQEDF